jgi:hypothetical protein
MRMEVAGGREKGRSWREKMAQIWLVGPSCVLLVGILVGLICQKEIFMGILIILHVQSTSVRKLARQHI